MSLDLVRKYLLLSSSHIFSVFIPFLVVPKFIGQTSEAVYGEIVLLQTILTYFNLIIDYNFNLEGINEVKKNVDLKSSIAFRILFKKLQLCLLLFPLYLFLNFFLFPDIPKLILVTSYLIPLSTALNPIWFFQALEKFKWQSFLIVLSKILFIFLVHLFIKDTSDAYLYNTFLALALIGPSIAFWSTQNMKVCFGALKISELKEGFKYCSSNIGINFYTSFQMISIGFYMPAKAIAAYAVVDRVVMGIRGVLSLLSVVIYPRMCSPDFNRKQTLELVVFLNLLVLLISIILFFNGELISRFFLDRLENEVVELTKILAFVPFVVSLNIYSYQYLLSRRRYSDTQKILLTASFLGIMSFLYFSFNGQLIALAWVTLFIEMFVTLSLLIIFFNLRKNENV